MKKTPQIPTTDFYTSNPRDPGLRLLLPGLPIRKIPSGR